jgi:CRP-like cAMP-binding protein
MANTKWFDVGEKIIVEGEVGDEAYLIKEGSVKITKIGPDDMPKTIAKIGKGAILGEMALIDDDLRSATAVAIAETEVMIIQRDDLVNRLEKTDPVVSRLLQTMSSRLKAQAIQIASMSA